MKSHSFALRVGVLGAAAFVAAFWAGQATGQTGAPPRIPVQTSRSIAPPPELLTIQGKGASQAAQALELARVQLPFASKLPAQLPGAYVPNAVEARILANGQAVLDVIYIGTGDSEYQLFEMNAPNTKAVSATIVTRDVVSIAGESWVYMLIVWPQPDGSRQLEHFVERPFDSSGPYTSASLRSTTGDLVSEKAALLASLASLR